MAKSKILSVALAAVFALTASVPGMMAQTASKATVAGETAAASSSDDLTMEQAFATPEVPPKLNAYIKGYMKREALALNKLGFKVETMRKGEIVIATMPTDKLFAPNDTVLLPDAGDLLKHFLPYFRTPGKFKVILAIHTDDTGNDAYLRGLSEKRIVSLYDYFDSRAKNTESLTGYPIAADDPLMENNTRDNRAANRRLEIYLMPDNVLIEEAKRGNR